MFPRCKRLVLLALWLFGVAGPTFAQAPASDGISLPPTERILDCVKRVTGLEAYFTVEKTEQVSLSEISKRYFWAPIKDKMGIRVSFAPGKITWDVPGVSKPDSYVRRFTVYLDADAKHVLAVTSRLAEKPPVGSPPCSPETFQPGLMDEVSGSLPSTDPKFSFVETLGVSGGQGIGNPRGAQEIDAFYVLYARNEKPHPAWIILMRGQPPFPAPMPYIPNAPKIKADSGLGESSTQDFVDALTGRLMFSGGTTTGGF